MQWYLKRPTTTPSCFEGEILFVQGLSLNMACLTLQKKLDIINLEELFVGIGAMRLVVANSLSDPLIVQFHFLSSSLSCVEMFSSGDVILKDLCPWI